MKEIAKVWLRPFEMFVRRPVVLCLILSGFSDALTLTFFESFKPGYEQWHFGTVALGLAFLPIIIGYFLAYFSFFPFTHRHRQIRRRDPDALQPEARLYWLLYTAPLERTGLFGFAWTSLGSNHGVHWIAPMMFSTFIAIASVGLFFRTPMEEYTLIGFQYATYMATIDCMVASYRPHSASATGGNALARGFLAGVAAMYSTHFHEYFHTYQLEHPSSILACIAFVVTIPIFIWKGPWVGERSKFAQTLAANRKAANAYERTSIAEQGSDTKV